MPRTSKPAAAPEHKKVTVGGSNNGSERIVPAAKAPRYYPAEDIPQPKKTRRVAKPTRLRQSIVPGSVLILLAGRFRGKRVVFLKQLPSGLLLVTGPYAINGVPLRRVNQAYVIATSTKIDISGCSVSFESFDVVAILTQMQVNDSVCDSYFTKTRTSKGTTAEEEFFSAGKPKEKESYPESKSTEQKNVDKAIIAELKKTPLLAKYLKSSFGLSKGQFPHQLSF
jgi:large subunit ribosomal protein L6e